MPLRLLPPTRWLTHPASAPPVTTTTDFMTPTPSRLLGILLADLWGGQVPAVPAASAALPRGHHLAYFRSEAAPSALLADGTTAAHAGAGSGPRVWAGGAVQFVGAVALDGGPGRCHEQVAAARRRGGAAFVDVWRRYGLAGAADDRVIERCTLRLATGRVATPVAAAAAVVAADADTRIVVTPRRAHLFAMSALTYNAHTIHLDASRLTADAPPRLTPGPPALLVQGSLMLTLALSLAESSLPFVSAMQYRCLAPLYCDEPMAVCFRRSRSPMSTSLVWIQRPDGCLAFSADIFAAEANGRVEENALS